jgi:hypothetical protein
MCSPVARTLRATCNPARPPERCPPTGRHREHDRDIRAAAADLDFGLTLGVDWIALSFVQGAADIVEAQAIIQGRAGIVASWRSRLPSTEPHRVSRRPVGLSQTGMV